MQTQTFNIALPKDLVKAVDLVAKKEYRNRSELIREALRVYLKESQEWEKLFVYGKSKAAKLGIKDEKDIDRIVYGYRHGKNSSKSRS
ncbi:CopG family transcriptional regulator [Candidatus Shapirobacteria bacterium CG08_land_8_20_14_0_20_39_18]|uniref:CopG family transcriptional regulator n=1 Tax=Candidatus Shapirobacteria bacterium CG08_land_8_20_14_0_20_39_18 TaxID=1974883 RepID=A0A2M6XC50_9BACT|nr:MAG: CopG family transcriptional regulator [Candidatus Shapirobacteria bacterium CG08_land_8_20_14_0_20_39_18]PIY66386.1 MAG: CopG family transcriptional regulator [Candidatus Shapirobacteria bacterium CG_4_10_14_0_8_um_filter_39_15]PJE68314.1 MAG: CopG family transcriptional regulator [Candidatus Shapirobacteria bacterium CG10_big_fil_rev_8_21_14_0_10_38_8]